LQGANILAASKLFETEINRNSTNFAGRPVSKSAFKDCLKKQSQQAAGSEPGNDENMAGTRQAGIKPAKLDRSTLLRTSSSPKNSQSKGMINDDSGTRNDLGDLENSSEVTNALNDSQGGTGQNPVVNVTPDTPIREDTANQVEKLSVLQVINQSGDSQPASGLTQISNNSAAEAMEGLNALPVEIKAAGEQLATDNGINNKVDIQPQSVSVQLGSDAPPTAAETSRPNLGVKEADQAIQPKPLAEPVQSTQVIIIKAENAVQTLTEQPEANPGAPLNEASAEASNQAQTVETPSAKAPMEMVNTAVAAAGLAANVIPKNGASDAEGLMNRTSPEADDKAPPTETKINNQAEISTKTPNDAKMALNDKLEESAAKNSSGLLEKKDSLNNGELKKIIEFESNRLHTTRLTSNSSELAKAGQAETPQMSSVTPGVDSLTASSLNKTTAADFTVKTPVDLKNIIDQVVQKAELLVKKPFF